MGKIIAGWLNRAEVRRAKHFENQAGAGLPKAGFPPVAWWAEHSIAAGKAVVK